MLSIIFTNKYKGVKDKTLVFPRLKTLPKMSNILSQNLSLFSCIITYLAFIHFALDVGTKSSSARQNIEVDNIFIDDSSLNHVINSALSARITFIMNQVISLVLKSICALYGF